MTPRLAAVISIILVAAALEPVVRAPADDGFPLSTFPMFASARPSELTMLYAQGVTAAGEPRARECADQDAQRGCPSCGRCRSYRRASSRR
jgi:hypothetical protein